MVKAPETQAAQPRPIASIGVVGGGTMGAGIAVAVLDAGLPVTMVERDDASIARGRANVEKVYDGLVAKGRMTPEGKAQVMARFQGSTSYGDLAPVDLVIEAVFEDLEVKKAVFAEFDRVCKPGAVLATNTSYLDIDAIAASISRPQDVIGLHFFSPANVMKLLEIVVPAKVSADAVATGMKPAQLQHVWRLHRDAVQKLNIVLFFGQFVTIGVLEHYETEIRVGENMLLARVDPDAKFGVGDSLEIPMRVTPSSAA